MDQKEFERDNPYLNSEGYADPTAYAGMKNIIREENDAERRASELVKTLRAMVRLAGFELTERIKIKDMKTGREFRGRKLNRLLRMILSLWLRWRSKASTQRGNIPHT